MILKIYSVFDNKANAFLPPFFMVNDAVARRAFNSAANDSSHQFALNPTDYCLFLIGQFDDSTGTVEAFVKLENLGMPFAD